jgi:hypothetical protein
MVEKIKVLKDHAHFLAVGIELTLAGGLDLTTSSQTRPTSGFTRKLMH